MSERYERILTVSGPFCDDTCVIQLKKYGLTRDTINDCTLIQAQFENMGLKPLKGLDISISCMDYSGSVVEEVKHSFLDLNIEQNSTFGDMTPIYLKNNTSRSFNFSINRLFFHDGSSDTSQHVLSEKIEMISLNDTEEFGKVIVPSNSLVHDYEAQELKAEFVTEVFEENAACRATMIPLFFDKKWICTCGTVNLLSEKCRCCNIHKAFLKEILDEKALAEKARIRQEMVKKQKVIEKEEHEKLEAIKKQEQEKQEALDEQARKKKNLQKKVFFSCLIVSIVLVMVLSTIYVKVLVPRQKLKEIKTEVENRNISALAALLPEKSEKVDDLLYDSVKEYLDNGEWDKATLLGQYMTTDHYMELISNYGDELLSISLDYISEGNIAEANKYLKLVSNDELFFQSRNNLIVNRFDNLESIEEKERLYQYAESSYYIDSSSLNMEQAYYNESLLLSEMGDYENSYFYYEKITDERMKKDIRARWLDKGKELIKQRQYSEAQKYFSSFSANSEVSEYKEIIDNNLLFDSGVNFSVLYKYYNGKLKEEVLDDINLNNLRKATQTWEWLHGAWYSKQQKAYYYFKDYKVVYCNVEIDNPSFHVYDSGYYSSDDDAWIFPDATKTESDFKASNISPDSFTDISIFDPISTSELPTCFAEYL